VAVPPFSARDRTGQDTSKNHPLITAKVLPTVINELVSKSYGLADLMEKVKPTAQ